MRPPRLSRTLRATGRFKTQKETETSELFRERSARGIPTWWRHPAEWPRLTPVAHRGSGLVGPARKTCSRDRGAVSRTTTTLSDAKKEDRASILQVASSNVE